MNNIAATTACLYYILYNASSEPKQKLLAMQGVLLFLGNKKKRFGNRIWTYW